MGNDYGRPKDVAGEQRMAFTSLEDAAFDVCFENTLTGRGKSLNILPLAEIFQTAACLEEE